VGFAAGLLLGTGCAAAEQDEAAAEPARVASPPSAEAAGTVTWRQWYGAVVPQDSLAGPHIVAGDVARSWEGTASGALLAAAFFAVAADPGMPRTMWEPVLAHAVPAAERDRALQKLAKKRQGLARRAGFAVVPVAADVPVRAWEPGIHVSGYDQWNGDRERAEVAVWAREDITHRWLVRTVTVRRAGAHWVLQLPLPPPWTAVENLPTTITPIATADPARETP
jgi:hypothetical protein